MSKIIYKDLSYEIVGAIFEVYNELGYGFKERYYEDAIVKELRLRGVKYKRQVSYDLVYKGEKIGRHQLDFLIENKIIVELKIGEFYSKRSIRQVNQYLKVSDLKLAILINITQSGVRFKRILNINN
ncbi:GxxExxY protein [Patescibacteria group bacterium]